MSQVLSRYPESLEAQRDAISANRLKVFVGVVVLISALGFFGYMAFQGATVYYYTVGELKEKGPTPEGRLVRVNGKLVPDSFGRENGSTLADFTLSDGEETMAAVHDGLLPALFFNEHSEIILEGTYSPNGVFESQNVIVKCPSKYVAADGSG